MKLTEDQFYAVAAVEGASEIVVRGDITMLIRKYEKGNHDGYPVGWACHVIVRMTEEGEAWKKEAGVCLPNRKAAIAAGMSLQLAAK